jgi:hypothetical protein
VTMVINDDEDFNYTKALMTALEADVGMLC